MAELYDYQLYNLASNLVRNIFDTINCFDVILINRITKLRKNLYMLKYIGFYADALRFWIGTRDKYHGM